MSAERWERVWAASGALTVVLFLGGLLFGDVLASGQYPALDAAAAEVRRYLVDNEGDVRALAFFDAALTHALLVLSYLAGGPAITLPLALLTGSVSAAAIRGRFLPRWLSLLGAAATVASLAAATTFLGPTDNRSATYGVLLLAALLGFAWLFLASVWLTMRLPRRAQYPQRDSNPY